VRAPAREDAVWIVSLLLLALWVRWPGMSNGYTSDELANVMAVSAWEIATDPEAGVNPPLLRLMFNVPFDDFTTPWAGRMFSMLCSLGAVVMSYLVGKAAARGHVAAGVLAAMLCVLHPIVFKYAAIYRVYAWWSVTALWHLWAMSRALEASDQDRRFWGGQAVVSAVLLPWIHYISVPVLLGWGTAVLLGMPGKRRWFGVYVVSAICVLPLVPAVLFQDARRVASWDAPLDSLNRILGMDLVLPMALTNPAARTWKALGFDNFHWPTCAALVFAAALLVHVLAWRRSPTVMRLITAGGIALCAGIYGLAHVQIVRDPTMVMMVVFMAPVLAALPALLPWTYARWAGWAILCWLIGDQLPDRIAWHGKRSQETNAVPAFVASWHDWDEVRRGRPVRVHPGYHIPTLYFYEAEEHFRRAPWAKACDAYSPCYVADDTVFGAIDDVGDGSRYDALLVSFDPFRPEGFASACRELWQQAETAIYDCSPAPAEDLDPSHAAPSDASDGALEKAP
jgi:hypothetical protein